MLMAENLERVQDEAIQRKNELKVMKENYKNEKVDDRISKLEEKVNNEIKEIRYQLKSCKKQVLARADNINPKSSHSLRVGVNNEEKEETSTEESGDDESVRLRRKATKRKIVDSTSRPDLSMVPPAVPVVPGRKPYNQAHISQTMIITDSMLGKINGRLIKQYIDISVESVLVKKFPGHTPEEIQFYCNYPLSNETPDKVIIVAGTNDLSRHYYKDRVIDEDKIVAHILNIAENAQKYGVKDIVVSGLMVRRGLHYVDSIIYINNKLKELCNEKGYAFIDQSDIGLHHISKDGIHLNFKGHTILKMNILKCFYSFNPYMCDFLDLYEQFL